MGNGEETYRTVWIPVMVAARRFWISLSFRY